MSENGLERIGCVMQQVIYYLYCEDIINLRKSVKVNKHWLILPPKKSYYRFMLLYIALKLHPQSVIINSENITRHELLKAIRFVKYVEKVKVISSRNESKDQYVNQLLSFMSKLEKVSYRFFNSFSYRTLCHTLYKIKSLDIFTLNAQALKSTLFVDLEQNRFTKLVTLKLISQQPFLESREPVTLPGNLEDIIISINNAKIVIEKMPINLNVSGASFVGIRDGTSRVLNELYMHLLKIEKDLNSIKHLINETFSHKFYDTGMVLTENINATQNLISLSLCNVSMRREETINCTRLESLDLVQIYKLEYLTVYTNKVMRYLQLWCCPVMKSLTLLKKLYEPITKKFFFRPGLNDNLVINLDEDKIRDVYDFSSSGSYN